MTDLLETNITALAVNVWGSGSLIPHMKNFKIFVDSQNLISLVENLVVYVRYTRLSFFCL